MQPAMQPAMQRSSGSAKPLASSTTRPASKKRTLDTEPSGEASGSAARPASLSEQVEQQVDQLGHYPKRFKTPATDEERAENALAKNISKQWSNLSDATKAKLTRLRQETQGNYAELEQQVEQLGHYPKRFKTPTTDKERSGNLLAWKITKQWSNLSDATKAKLSRFQQETRSNDAEKQAERRAEDILERLRAFGKWPQEHAYSQASNADVVAEARLAHDLRKCRSSGILNKAAVAEIDELHWIWAREREAGPWRETLQRRPEDEMQPKQRRRACGFCLGSCVLRLRGAIAMISLTGMGFGVATQSWQSVCVWLVIISSTAAWPAVLYCLAWQLHLSRW